MRILLRMGGLSTALIMACADDGAPERVDTEGGTGSSTTGTATDLSTSTETMSTGEVDSIEVTAEVTLYPEQPLVADIALTVSETAELTLTHTFDPGVRIDAIEQDGLRTVFRARGLSPATVHGIDYTATSMTGSGSGTVEFHTEAPLPGFIPFFPVTGAADPSDPPYRLLDVSDFPSVINTGLYFIDTDGFTRWHFAALGLQPPRPESIAGAAKLLDDGTVAFVHSLDFEIRDELNARVVRHTYQDLEAGGLHHEVLQLPSGNFMVLAFTFQTITYPEGDRYVAGDEVIEFTAEGEVVWRWNSFDHLDPQRTREGFSPTVVHPDTGELAFDWTHANGMDYDADNDTFLVSLRHQDWVINIDHATGDILWRLGDEGDFTLMGDTHWFFHQHSPQWQDDGSMLLYDNDLGRPGVSLADSESRAVRYELDMGAMTATLVWEDDAEQFASPFASDADGLPSGRVLVLDSALQTPPGQGPLHSRLRELDPSSSPQQVWSLETPQDTWSYRATAQSRLPGQQPARNG
jgi:hypothetical protein